MLLVIDDSPSPNGVEELTAKVGVFLNQYAAARGDRIDLQVGVVSTDMGAGTWTNGDQCHPGGDRGVLRAPLTCNLGGARFVSVRSTAEVGHASVLLSCLMKIGGRGCGYEHHLAAARAAASGAVPENAGFVRPDADLAIVILGDEDDCSAPPDSGLFAMDRPGETSRLRCVLAGHECDGAPVPAREFTAPLSRCRASPDGGGQLIPVADIVRDIRAAKPARNVFVGAVIGWPADPSSATYSIERVPDLSLANICSGPGGSGSAGLRLKAFTDAVGKDGILQSVCAGGLDQFWAAFAQLVGGDAKQP